MESDIQQCSNQDILSELNADQISVEETDINSNTEPEQVVLKIDEVKSKPVDFDDVDLPFEWLKLRDSFDNLVISEKERDLLKNKKPQSEESLLQDKSLLPKYIPVRINSSLPSGISKIIQWDPWHKIGRKNKDKNKKKSEKKKAALELLDSSDGPKSSLISEPKTFEDNKCKYEPNSENSCNENQQFLSETVVENICIKIRKVRFQTEVLVLHYACDEIVGQTIEPLKKEVEQQERNKEIRKEFDPESVRGLKVGIRRSASDYMSVWYKK